MRKKMVLDTSVLVYDPSAHTSFKGNDVIIPIDVLDELDKLKKLPNDTGRNARVAIRNLDSLSNTGDILAGITVNDSKISIDSSSYGKVGNDSEYTDNKILACALKLCKGKNKTTIVSRDINLRIRAKALNMLAEDYEKDNIESEDLYKGYSVIENQDAGSALKQLGFIDINEYKLDLNINQCVSFEDKNWNEIALGRKVSDNKIKLIKKVYPWDLSPRNKEQIFALDLIMDKKIDLITLAGSAGTGKSLCAIAAAMDLVLNKREYEKMVIYRPIQSVSGELGFTPGTVEEKLEPWFQAVNDSFEHLLSNSDTSDWRKELEMYKKKGRIEYGAISYIRGRSIHNSIIILDEAQNLSKEDVKTILTRAGENTKFILCGDYLQIDTKHLDAINNGLTYIIEKFKTSELAGHITFEKGERSALASLAATIL